MTTTASHSFAAPGPGAWELETTHFTRPGTRLFAELSPRGMRDGFGESTARYGLGLSHFETAQVQGFLYQKAIAYGAPPNATKPPPKLVLQVLSRVHPGMRARWKTADAAMSNRIWRDDLRRWDEEVKPAAIRKHREIQSVEPDALSDDELVAYVKRCYQHAGDMVHQHHVFTISCALPLGDLLAHVRQWTGMPTAKVLDALRGSSPISVGVAAEELDALASAIAASDTARATLASTKAPMEVLDGLRGEAGPVAEALKAYLDAVGFRCLGYDPGDPCALEMPEVLVKAIRAKASSGARAPADEGRAARIAALREAIPEAHRATFDGLMEEARYINRLRDERGVYSDGWGSGLLRRSVLALGRRLVARGLIDEATLAVEAGFDELMALARGERAVTSDELRARAAWRRTKSIADAPQWLGAEPAPPPPAEWLPENARRSQRATLAFLECLFQPAPEAKSEPTVVSGLPVNVGVYEGTARLVLNESEFVKIQQGDVLVTRATSPYFNVVLPMLGAIVTDRGGQLSHAAIVAREFGIPGVVGTRDATVKIPDGARVRVDGTRGVVEVIG
jgi:pyruvate,water dikinase